MKTNSLATPSPSTKDELQLQLNLQRSSGFSLDIQAQLPGQGISVLYGPSGSGKSTVLRCVAGLERAALGRVSLGNTLWQDGQQGVFIPTWQRRLGYVFQEPSLFAHLDVRGNIEYGLRRMAGWGKYKAQQEKLRGHLDAAIALLGIEPLLSRQVAHLSGGEKQRVAIARALATAPQLLLLDEPLAALDRARRLEVLPWLERLRRELRLPMLYVTHSSEELARLADYVLVLEQGRVRTKGEVQAVLAAPDSAAWLGDEAGAVVQAQVAERDSAWQLLRVEFAGGSLWVQDQGQALGSPMRLRVLARDISIQLQAPQGSSVQNALACELQAIHQGLEAGQVLLSLRCGKAQFLARLTARAAHDLQLQPHMPVWALVKAVAVLS